MSDQIENYSVLAETATGAGNHKEAVEYYNKILEIDPSNAKAWFGKAVSSLYASKIGNILGDEAIVYFKKSVELDGSENNKIAIVKAIVPFCDQAFINITNHYTTYSSTKNAAYDHTERYFRLVRLLSYAEILRVEEKYVIGESIKLCSLFLQKNNLSGDRAKVKGWLAKYNEKMKGLDPGFKSVQPSGCILILLVLLSGLLGLGYLVHAMVV